MKRKVLVLSSVVVLAVVVGLALADIRPSNTIRRPSAETVPGEIIEGNLDIVDAIPTIDFKDRMATDSDPNVRIIVNCTDTGSGTEDCDVQIQQQEAGAIKAAFVADADGGITIGNATNDSITFTTDGTGDGEVTYPPGSVGPSDIFDGYCAQVVSVSFNPTEAGATNDFVSLSAVDIVTGDASFSATETGEDQFMVPVAMIVHSLRVLVDVAPGAGVDDWKVTIRDDGVSTTVTCNIDETATSCTHVATTPAVAAQSKLDVLVDSSGAGADPAAAAEMIIAFCLTQ